MQKAHNNVDWKNWPDISTPLSQSNLNAMDQSIDVIDDRVIVLDTTKANQSDLLTAVARLEFDDESGILTIYYKNGLTDTIDTGLAKLTMNWDYDNDPTSEHYQDLVLEMADGTYKYVDLSALINNHEFADTSTINITITNGVVSADVIDGSITDQKLETNYLANITTQANHAAQAASAAAISESNASDSAGDSEDSALVSEGWAVGKQNGADVEVGSDYFENNSKYYKDQAEASATSAAGSATSANLSAGSAQNAFVGASEIQTDVTNMRNAVRTWQQDVQQNATSVASNTATAQTASNTAVNASNAAVAANSSAQSAATRAEAAADRAEEIVDLDVMTPTRNGIGKPDGVTITVDENGTFSTVASLHMEFVDVLPPISSAHANVIYCIPTSGSSGDIYQEWVVGYDEEEEENVWVQIGDTSVDLTNYTTKTYVDNHIDLRISTQTGVHGIRYYNEKLQRFDGTTWIDISTGGSGGHTIMNKNDVPLTPRSNLKFGGYLNASDDSSNVRTVVDDTPTAVTRANWNAMSAAQKAGTKWLITNSDGTKSLAYGADEVNNGHGHTILNSSGTLMTQRDSLMFTGDLSVSDDSRNGRTVVSYSPGIIATCLDYYLDQDYSWGDIISIDLDSLLQSGSVMHVLYPITLYHYDSVSVGITEMYDITSDCEVQYSYSALGLYVTVDNSQHFTDQSYIRIACIVTR